MDDNQKLTPAQRKLVEDNAPLAKFLAHKRWEMAPGHLDYEELVSLAYQGLVNAALRFDPTREDITPGDVENGKAFAGYARTKIIGAILDWQKRDADHVPRSYRTDYKILQRHGYPEKTRKFSELSAATDLTVERIKMVVAAVERMPVSFDGGDIGGGGLRDVTPADSNVEGSVILTSIGSAVADRVSKLPQLQQVILALRYFEGQELQAIALELDVSLAAVREQHNAAIEAVHEAMVAAVTTEGE